MAQKLEALYVAQFGDVALGGHYRPGGVVVLTADRLLGGDSGYYYVGTYTVEDAALRARIKVVKHDPAAEDAFGDRGASFEVDIQLTIGDGRLEGAMERLDRPGLKLPVRLIRKEGLT